MSKTYRKPGIGRSIALTALYLLVLPVLAGVLWLAGRAVGSVAGFVGGLNISWSYVALGAAVLVGFGLLVAAVHAGRSGLARRQSYSAAIAEMS